MRLLPAVDMVLKLDQSEELIRMYGYGTVRSAARSVLAQMREEFREISSEETAWVLREETVPRIRREIEKNAESGFVRVLNGTGIILHTGLGRAPYGQKSLHMAETAAAGYTNLEYDLEKGTRGNRCARLEQLLCRITGAEAAFAVNNNAGAVLLALRVVAEGGEAVVSRGELVEIGGGFRIPEVMELSGAKLREVGTTNRTRPSDYEAAVGPETKAVMKVHTSNYRIVGFTESVTVKTLSQLCAEKEIPLLVDLGSGMFIDLKPYGFPQEPTVQETVQDGADIVCFSGDKLLGGPQAGIIVGKKRYVEKIRKHPLSRALRIDKVNAAALEGVLLDYLDCKKDLYEVPVLRMLTMSAETVRERAESLARQLCSPYVRVTVEPCMSRAGGGAMPGVDIPSWSVCIEPENVSAELLGKRLRQMRVPVISVVRDNRVWLDMRTFELDMAGELVCAFRDGTLAGPIETAEEERAQK